MRSPIYAVLALVALLGVSCASSSASPSDGVDLSNASICRTAAPLKGDQREWFTTATAPDTAVSVLTKLQPIVPEEHVV